MNRPSEAKSVHGREVPAGRCTDAGAASPPGKGQRRLSGAGDVECRDRRGGLLTSEHRFATPEAWPQPGADELMRV